MKHFVRRAIGFSVARGLAPFGLKIVRSDAHDFTDVRNFIPLKATIDAAKARGLSVGDYVDEVLNGVPGSSQAAIDFMAAAGVFGGPIDAIVEIGPGTGRYLEKTIKACHPSRYEIYETAQAWAEFLVANYDVILQAGDGFSMPGTRAGSMDLAHAHKVFSTIPFVATCAYWHEMVRVVKPNGWIAFDVITERCLPPDATSVWAKSGIRNGTFPAVMPSAVPIEFFAAHNFHLVASHVVPLPPATTELMIFRRTRPD